MALDVGGAGFPPGALDFYAALEQDNSRDFWLSHKAEWERAVREPMLLLTEELADEFGEARLFRPNRDIRFSNDKSPYKTHQGAFAAASPGTGFYVEISADGLRTGGGFRAHSAAETARWRQAVAAPAPGAELMRLVAALDGEGYEVLSERVKTAPRGYPGDHPRIGMLRYKDLMLVRSHGAPDWLGTERLADEVRDSWRAVRPVVEWVRTHVDRS